MALTATDSPLDSTAAVDIARQLNALGLSPTVEQAIPLLGAALSTERECQINTVASWLGAHSPVGDTTLDNHTNAAQAARDAAQSMEPTDQYPRNALISICTTAMIDYQVTVQSGKIQDGLLASLWSDALYYALHPRLSISATSDILNSAGTGQPAKLTGPGTAEPPADYITPIIDKILSYGPWVIGGVVVVVVVVVVALK